MRSCLVALILWSVLASATDPTPADYRCLAGFTQLMRQREQAFLPIPEMKIEIGGKAYLVNRAIGSGSALVLQTSDGNHVVKIYQKQDAGLARHEYWATRYLKEKGVDVPAVLSPPEAAPVNLPPELLQRAGIKPPFFVVAKEYVKGLGYLDVMGAEDRLPYALQDPRKIHREINLAADAANAAFSGGKYVQWLRAQGVDPDILHPNFLGRPDSKKMNFMYIHGRGWVLIDP